MNESQRIILKAGFEVKELVTTYSIACRTCPECWLLKKGGTVPLSEILELLNHQAMHVRLPRLA